jgi:hypothetical protein
MTALKLLLDKPQRNSLFGRHRRKWKKNIPTNVRELDREDMSGFTWLRIGANSVDQTITK